MSATTTLPSCPFCKGAPTLGMAGKLPFFSCEKCGAASEPAPTEDLAAKNWRTRVRAFEARPSAWFHRPADGAIAA